MMFLLFFIKFVAFPEKRNGILAKSERVNVESSGSIGIYYENKCHITNPNATLTSDSKMDWCSNIAKPGEANPWVSFNIPNKAMSLTGFAVRNGCCYYSCCCIDDDKHLDMDICCCRLYSFSLQGSNDNVTWKTIHKVEKAEKFYLCSFREYEFPQTTPYAYIRFALDESFPNCPSCLQINQIELYGEAVDSLNSFVGKDEEDESVSIIGKIRKDNHE